MCKILCKTIFCDTIWIWQNHFYSLPSFFIPICTVHLSLYLLRYILRFTRWTTKYLLNNGSSNKFISFYLESPWTYPETTQNVIHPTTHAINQKKVDMWICRKKSEQKTEISFPYKSVFLMREFCGLNLKEFWSPRLRMPSSEWGFQSKW